MPRARRTRRRTYFLRGIVRVGPRLSTIRQKIVVRYRALIVGYRGVKLYKQFFKILQHMRENDEVLSKGEMIAVLREELSTGQPTPGELDAMNTQAYLFRKWIGVLGGMIVYSFRMELTRDIGVEWVYQPIKNRRDYRRYAGDRLNAISSGMIERDQDNEALFSLTQRQIDNLIAERNSEIDLEAEFGENE